MPRRCCTETCKNGAKASRPTVITRITPTIRHGFNGLKHLMRKSFSASFSGRGSLSIKVNSDPSRSCSRGATSVFVNTCTPSGFNNSSRSKVTAAYVYTTNSEEDKYVTKVGRSARSCSVVNYSQLHKEIVIPDFGKHRYSEYNLPEAQDGSIFQ